MTKRGGDQGGQLTRRIGRLCDGQTRQDAAQALASTLAQVIADDSATLIEARAKIQGIAEAMTLDMTANWPMVEARRRATN